MEQDRVAYLFSRYVNKTASPEELDEFKSILSNVTSADNLEKIFDDFWDESIEVELQKDKASEIFNKVISSDKNVVEIKPNRSVNLWIGWAAAIFIFGISTFFIVKSKPGTKSASALTASVNNSATTPSSKYITAKTLNDHQKITLPDGSTVILNNNSSITYLKVFSENKREVFLNGEGYFDIKHDNKKTFTVYTGEVKTVVLGTAFNIKAYDTDKDIKVTVTRGKVSVANKKSVLGILTPNQQITCNRDYVKSSISQVVAKDIVQWQQSDLYFDDVSMEQAAQILSKRFNTAISFTNDHVKKCRFTATFSKGESIDEILKVICSYNNAQYQLVAGGITVKGQGCE